jgi:hypothetical protein
MKLGKQPIQNFELTCFEAYFKSWQEQQAAIWGYLKEEHRIKADWLVKDLHKIKYNEDPSDNRTILICQITGEQPEQVYLRFKAFFPEEERDIMVSEWRHKHRIRGSWRKPPKTRSRQSYPFITRNEDLLLK